MASGSQGSQAEFRGGMSLGNCYDRSQSFPPLSLSSAWSEWDDDEEARLDAELDLECDPTPEQIEKNMEVTELCEMTREDHRWQAVEKMDTFAYWSTCIESIRAAGYDYVPPLPWRRDQDGPSDPNDPANVEFEERVNFLRRLYEDTVWKEGDPPPETGTNAHRIYRKRKAEKLVKTCSEIDAANKTLRAEREALRAQETPHDSDAESESGREKQFKPARERRLLSDEFLLSLEWPGGIESWLGKFPLGNPRGSNS